MDSPGGENAQIKGDFVCRPAWWMDVVKFLAFNIALHALTVRHAPGAGTFHKTVNIVKSVLLPYSGIGGALMSMTNFAAGGKDALEVARRAGALCMVQPGSSAPNLVQIMPTVVDIHGQHPVPSAGLWSHFKAYWQPKNKSLYKPISSKAPYHLVEVPYYMNIKSDLDYRTKATSTGSSSITEREGHPENMKIPQSELNLCCNHSILKIIAAIFQTFYGSYELYRAREFQINTYGFAAYSLSVIPYIIMSLVNLTAALIEPEYPTMYLVHYAPGGQNEPKREDPAYNLGITCAVGLCVDPVPETFGEWVEREDEYDKGVGCLYGPGARLISLFIVLPTLIAAPYVIIYLLTGFRRGHDNNTSHQALLMSWLVLGQIFGVLLTRYQRNLFLGGVFLSDIFNISTYKEPTSFKEILANAISTTDITPEALLLELVSTLVLSGATFGGFVAVSEMILKQDVCMKI